MLFYPQFIWLFNNIKNQQQYSDKFRQGILSNNINIDFKIIKNE
jgi:hypothetical protein